MTKLPYEINLEGDPRKGPTGKIPFVEINGKLIGDSGIIQNILEQQAGVNFHKNLSPEQKAIGLAFTRLIEEHLYWVLVYSRWFEDENWVVTKSLFFSQLPIPLRWVLPNIIRKQVFKNMHGHGIGRHPKTTIYQLAAADLAAISDFMADKKTMFGGEPTAVDATLYGLLSSILDADFDTELKRSALQHQNLTAFTARMRQRYFPDL